MACYTCAIVPPYLLRAIAENHRDEPVGEAAANTLALARETHRARRERSQAHHVRSSHSSGHADSSQSPPGQSVVPHYLLEQISNAEGVDDATKDAAQKTLATSRQTHEDRIAGAAADKIAPSDSTVIVWRGVYDMAHVEYNSNSVRHGLFPGKPVRVEGQPASADEAANEAYDNCEKVLDFYKAVFKYNSLDNNGMSIISSVHVGQKLGNAMWSPDLQQMVYGDGDGRFLFNLTGCLDVIGHEMTVSEW